MILFYLLLTTSLGYFIFNYINITSRRFQKPIYYKLDDKDYTKNRYSKNKLPLYIDTIVIGSGIGGLTTAALLAKSGKKVVVFEQHTIAGGTTHVFEEKGIEHETGIHYIGNIKKRLPILNLISDKKIEWCELGSENNSIHKIYDEIIVGDNHYKFEAGLENLKYYLIDKFPEEHIGIQEYFKLVTEVSKKDLYFMLKVFPYRFLSQYIKYIQPSYVKYCETSAYDVIKELINDEELISVLCGQMGDYGQTPKDASFFIHASIVNHYLDGGWFPKGGPSVIANNIIKTIEEYNGNVFVGKAVKSLFIRNNECIGVIMDDDQLVYSKNVVSSIGMKNTFNKLLENIEFKEKELYDNFLSKCSHSVQHLYTFVKLKGSPKELNLPSSNYWIYPHNDYEKVFDDFNEDPFEAPMPIFLGFSCAKDSSWNERYPGYSNAILITTVSKKFFDEWENKKCTNRGSDYKDLKTIFGKRLIEEGLLKYFPQTKDKIESYNVATPLTTQFYFNNIDGDSYGIKMDNNKLLNGELCRPKTSIDNLYLTGQDICTLGFTGAMMSGVLTANVVLKYDNIVDICLGNNVIKDLLKK